MKKTLALLLTAIAVFTFTYAAGACGSKKPADLSGNTDNYVELEWWTGYPLGITPPDLDAVLDAFNLKLKEKLNCKVNFHFVDWMGYTSTLALKINAQDDFDICFTGSMYNDYFSNVAKEAFFDLTDLLSVYAPDIIGTVDKKYQDIVSVNGKTYGVINRQIAARQYAAVFKKSTFEDYTENAASYGNKTPAKSLDQITRVDDVTDYLAFVSDKYATNYITSTFDMEGLCYYWGMDNFGNWKIPGVVRYNDDTYTVVNQFESQEWKDAMTLARSWYRNNYYWPNMATQSPNFSKFHMRFAPAYKPNLKTEEYMLSSYDTVSAKLGPSVIYTHGMITAMNAISATSKNPVRALQVLNLLYTDKELYNLLVYGIEGTHYDVIETLENGLKVVRRKNSDRYSMPSNWAFGDTFNTYIEEGLDHDVWEQTEQFDEDSEEAVTFGFVFDPTPVKTQITTCQAVVNNDWYTLMIGLGKTDDWLEDTYQTFLRRLNQAGAQTIMEEKQRQLNAWVAAKKAG